MPVTIGGSGPITGVTSINTTVSDTELGYLDGVSSALQTQINAKAADSSQGLYLITPSSIANSGGSASASGGAVTITGVTSISLNGVFSSTYENYLLVIRGTKSEGTANVDFRFRASGSDDTGSNYVRRYLTSGGAGTTVSAGEVTTTAGTICPPGTSSPFAIGADAMILGPNLASQTLVRSLSFPSYLTLDGTRHTQSTAYDGITLLTGTGNITAVIRVYGFKN